MRQRHLGKMFLLTMVTLGLYQLYWLVKTRAEIMEHKGVPEIPSMWVPLTPAIVLGGLVLFSWLFRVIHGGDNTTLNATLFVLAFFAIIALGVLILRWIWSYGQAIEYLTGGETNHSYVFWMWMLLVIISTNMGWSLIMQHELNIIAKNEMETEAEARQAAKAALLADEKPTPNKKARKKKS
ncbi:MAG TPA: DUF4234 domain-containing protein [Candidatus Saccharimonadales bacterium]|nr:DUF4234 domain-containing protein [Candidatus Saccharimonadales bacterium]